jgi:UDP-GlcNAc:undecaprenyl-phosphate GlcNAc-1-phosphate transferase
MMADMNMRSALDYSAVLQPYMPVFYASFLATVILTPLMRGLAHRHGIIDDPDGKRKVHTQPIAYLGGVSIFLGWLAGVGISVFLRPHNFDANLSPTVQIPPGVLLGAATVVLFGLLDDVYSLRPRVKLIGQLLAALFLILPAALGKRGGDDFFLGPKNGFAWMVIRTAEAHGFALPPNVPHIGYLAAAVSAAVAIAIIISTCNATNLLDGLDGLCSGVTGVMSVGYLVLAVYLAHQGLAVPGGHPADPLRITLSLALLGAVLGFLPFNFNPASIFMGDTGSMFLGYMCGTMILLFAQFQTVKWFLAAIIIFGLPMMDTLLAIVRRKLNGKPIFTADSNHFHHFLVRRGLTVRKAVLISYTVAAVFVSFGLIIVIMPTPLALGIYLVLFGWIIVAAFKMGMIFQNAPKVAANTSINLAVITPAEAVATNQGTLPVFSEVEAGKALGGGGGGGAGGNGAGGKAGDRAEPAKPAVLR